MHNNNVIYFLGYYGKMDLIVKSNIKVYSGRYCCLVSKAVHVSPTCNFPSTCTPTTCRLLIFGLWNMQR